MAGKATTTIRLGPEKGYPRIELTMEAKRAITELSERFGGMNEYVIASKVYLWFAEQPDAIQRTVLGLFGEHGPDIARLILEREANRNEEEKGRAVAENGRKQEPGAA